MAREGFGLWCCGDGYQTVELALIALLEAPVPPFFVKREVWEEVRAQEGAPKP